MSTVVPQGWRTHRSRRVRAPEAQLLLLLASASSVRLPARDRVAELATRSDPLVLHQAMARQRVLGSLGPRLLELAQDVVEPALAAAITEHRRLTRARGQLQEMALDHVLATLAGAEIPVVTLKGPRFARAVYGDLDSRPFGDLDLLVATDRLHDAQTVLDTLGWQDRGDLVDANGLPLLHIASVHAGSLPTVELHWRVHWYERDFAQAALRRSVAAGSDRLLPADELLALLLYAARDGLAGLRLAVDTVTWLEQHGDEPTTHLEGLLEQHPELRRAAEVGLRFVAAVEGLGRPVPRATSRRSRVADTFADPLLLMPVKQTIAERSLVDILLAPSPSDAVRRQLIPSARVLRAWADHQAQPPSGTEVVAHTARSLRRYALAGLLRIPTATRTAR